MMSPATVAVIGGAWHASQRDKQQEEERKRIEAIVKGEQKSHIFGARLLKKSKYLGMWKERYIQITKNYIFSFKPGKQKGTHLTFPTELIPIKSIQSVGRFVDEKDKKHVNLMHLYGSDKDGVLRNFYFDCESDADRQKWIARIKNQMQTIKKPPTVAAKKK